MLFLKMLSISTKSIWNRCLSVCIYSSISEIGLFYFRKIVIDVEIISQHFMAKVIIANFIAIYGSESWITSIAPG